MNRIKKGGIATIVATIIMVGLVLALIVSTVVPVATEGQDTAKAGVGMLNDLQASMEA